MKKVVSVLLVTVLVAFSFVATSVIGAQNKVLSASSSVVSVSSGNAAVGSSVHSNATLTSAITVVPMATRKGCDATYTSDCKKCGRLRGGARVKAICYAAATARYATCIATAKQWIMLRKYYANRKLVATCELCEPVYQRIDEDDDVQAWCVGIIYKPVYGDMETYTIYGEDAVQSMELALQFLHDGIEKVHGLVWSHND